MFVGSATLLSLSANVTLAVSGAALVLLVLWQDARRRGNQYFGLCMTFFALYGAFNCPMQVAQQYDLDPVPLLKLLSTVYIGGIVLLFNFVLAFAGLPRRFRQLQSAISIPLSTLFIALVWLGFVFEDFKPLPAGSYRYNLTLTGMVGVGVAMLYLVSMVALLYRQHNPHARDLSIPILLLVLGVFVFSVTPRLREYSLNAVAVAASAVMLGRIVVRQQVFKPLADLNDALASKNDELAEATRQKAQFLASMSHELRTPLNSILGYTELVSSGTYGDLTELQRDRLQKIMRNGRLLLQLINDVLDLSKIEAGRLDLKFTQVPTVELLDGLLQEYEPKALEKGLSLVRGYGKLPALGADEIRARQILENLLSNAIKFTEHGVVIVRGHFDAVRQQVVVSITDTGPGIDPALQEHIFDAFRPMDSPLLGSYDGTGLGLAIARRLTEMHGGSLWFESVVGQGTTFHVALPSGESLTDTAAVIRPKARSKGPLILVIDDNREAIEVLQDQLETAHFRVCGVCDANQALQLVHEMNPALITLDVKMPGLDGRQVLTALRSDPVTASIPVLIISAMDKVDPEQYADANAFVLKPVRPEVLLEHVRRLLNRASSSKDSQPREEAEE
jgi:signal transduction histidine kinase/CheY-like chemotaxis protein